MNTSTGRGSDLDAELSRLSERINDLEYRQAEMMEKVILMLKSAWVTGQGVQVQTAPARPEDREQKSSLLFPSRLPGFD